MYCCVEMNKGRRNELRKLRYLRTVKRFPKMMLVDNNAFKSDRVPCSCFICRDEKYRDRQRGRDKDIIRKIEFDDLY